MCPLRDFHEPYLGGNRVIADLVMAGSGGKAERHLSEYLTTTRHQLVRAYDQAAQSR